MNKRQSSDSISLSSSSCIDWSMRVPIEKERPLQSIIASCNSTNNNLVNVTRNRLIFFVFFFFVWIRTLSSHFLSLSYSQINMNYEKWPFNLWFSQFNRLNAFVFHFQLWISIFFLLWIVLLLCDCFVFIPIWKIPPSHVQTIPSMNCKLTGVYLESASSDRGEAWSGHQTKKKTF